MKFSFLPQLTKVSISSANFVLKTQLSKVLWFLCCGPPSPFHSISQEEQGWKSFPKFFIYSFFCYTRFRRTEGKEQK